MLKLVTKQLETIHTVILDIRDKQLLHLFAALYKKHVRFQNMANQWLAGPLQKARSRMD